MKCACMLEEYTQDPQQGRCEYQRLRIPCIPNHKLFDPNNENQKKDYYYSLLSLFVLVKDENDLLKPNETAEQSFIRNYADGSCLHKHQQTCIRCCKQRIKSRRSMKLDNLMLITPCRQNM